MTVSSFACELWLAKTGKPAASEVSRVDATTAKTAARDIERKPLKTPLERTKRRDTSYIFCLSHKDKARCARSWVDRELPS